MANTIVSGMQWGDEGKGKIVDLLCPAFEGVVRYQGGDNAGHTVKYSDRHFALHLVPSGILHPGTRCVLGNGMVINPEKLFQEIDGLLASGLQVEGNLFIANRAHVLLPIYCELDAAREATKGSRRIGTTVRGIGPAYECKAARFGIRMCDLFAEDLEVRVRRLVERLNWEIVALGGAPVKAAEAIVEDCIEWRKRLGPMMCDAERVINEWIDHGDSLLFEGAQGVLLDIDHGTYPYVTSSNPTAGGACTGSGVAPTRIDGVIGVLKAYSTRVGGGPFVTELEDATGEALRDKGKEFGTTTGRPRRCGWLDLVAVRYARMVGGVDTIALTKLDVLDDLEEISVCTGYRVGGEVLEHIPASLDVLTRAEPIYKTVPGWQQSTVGEVDYDRLPSRAREYVALLEKEIGAPVGLVSTGPRREETILRDEAKLHDLTSGRLAELLSERHDELT